MFPHAVGAKPPEEAFPALVEGLEPDFADLVAVTGTAASTVREGLSAFPDLAVPAGLPDFAALVPMLPM